MFVAQVLGGIAAAALIDGLIANSYVYKELFSSDSN
jgi:hypothetical protein